MMAERAARRNGDEQGADGVRLQQMMAGHWAAQAVYVATRLGIPDLLADGPRACDELAAAAGAHGPSLIRLLRALAGLGVFAEADDGRFALTPMGRLLQAGAPGTWRAEVLLLGEVNYRAFGDLLRTVRFGETAFDHVYGTGFYDYLAHHPEAAGWFNECMTKTAAAWVPAFVQAMDFSDANTVVDMGGGDGGLMAAVLRANPSLRGVVFDLPHAAEAASAVLAAAGVGARATVVHGDFLTTAPPGGDVYILARVLLNWGDYRASAILANCRRAMSGRGRLVVVDVVLPPRGGPLSGSLNDLNLMVMFPDAHQRTEEEFRVLFAKAGLTLTQIKPLSAPDGLPLRVIEGIPA